VAAKNDAQAVFAIEPVGNLRQYMKDKAQNQDLSNFFTVDGLITEIPFPNNFADICMGGHVFGDAPEAEDTEMTRVTKPGGMVVLCPGNNDKDEGWHQFLVEQGYQWSRFEEPEDDIKRKYWKIVK
jgi:ubiquinone/menaquinone biosynthesis C-methylase UbiE